MQRLLRIIRARLPNGQIVHGSALLLNGHLVSSKMRRRIITGAPLLLALTLARSRSVEGAEAVPVAAAIGLSGGSSAPPRRTETPRRRTGRHAPPEPVAGGAHAGRAADGGLPVVPHPAGQAEFNTCHQAPPGQRVVKLNLQPDTALPDLVAWISSVTCRQFIVPGSVAAGGKKVTILAPALITREEAYRVFLTALDSVGLTVEPSGKALKIIETVKAKSASIPLYGFDGRPLLETSSSSARTPGR
jgi:hypothetical protein